MLTVQIPSPYAAERRYVLGVVLGEFLGLDYRIEEADGNGTSLTAGDGRELFIADGLFAGPERALPGVDLLPSTPLMEIDLESLGLDAPVLDSRLPAIYGRDPREPGYLSTSGGRIELGLDVFGSIFFMLSRLEEMVLPDRDVHGRFPSGASLAGREGFLDRPIVNEYVEVLWACMSRLWPSLERRHREFRVVPTHDVDCPAYYEFYPKREILMGLAGDLVKRRSFSRFSAKLRSWIDLRSGLSKDPFDTFDWLMDRSEASGLSSTFNFMAGGETAFDHPRYPLDHRMVGSLMSRINERGHEIGFHPSYATVTDERRWRAERDALLDRIPAGELRGGRQHYLRFEAPATWRLWADAGMEYDSTLTYADRAGFRCGTCYEFTAYDLERRGPLNLKERPTTLMESTVISDRYMGLGSGPEARELIGKLKERCRAFSGDFVLLWHNSALDRPEYRDLYEFALSGGA